MQQELVLLVRAAGQLCALPIAHVIETSRPLPVRALVGVDEAVLGVSIIRGTPTVVIDASRLFGAAGLPQRFVSLRVRERVIALAVDAVIGVHRIALDELAPLPTLVAADALAALGAADAELLLVLDAGRLVPDYVAIAIAEKSS